MTISSIPANQAKVTPPAQNAKASSEAKANEEARKASDQRAADTVAISRQAQDAAAAAAKAAREER